MKPWMTHNAGLLKVKAGESPFTDKNNNGCISDASYNQWQCSWGQAVILKRKKTQLDTVRKAGHLKLIIVYSYSRYEYLDGDIVTKCKG